MTKVTLFSQIISLLPRVKFQKLVIKHKSDKGAKGLNSWHHLVTMIFSHLGKVDSVRDISLGLKLISDNINHLGLKRVPSKSSISYMNKNRSWELFKDYYFELLDHLSDQPFFNRKKHIRIKKKIFLLDSTTIPLSLKACEWAYV